MLAWGMPAPNVYEEVGRHLRARRKRLGMTLEQLAERSGLTASYIGQVERDVRKTSLKTLAALAAALDVKVGALFDVVAPLAILPLGRRLESLLRSHTSRESALLVASLRHLSRGLKDLRGASVRRLSARRASRAARARP
jgi:transcriptional regulator with XRE-family HTH domain